jgi:solute carrier family 25 carnitine/acylcarnitine transporter 20/29
MSSSPAPAAPPKTSPVLKLGKDILAGTCGGIAVVFTGHPFDTVKVRLQSQDFKNPIYNGPIDCVKKTVQWEGLPGLYKGVTSPLAGQMFFRSVLFGAFGQSKSWLATNSDGTTRTLSYADFYKAGAITGFVAAFVEGPIDFFKSQLQVQILRSKSDPSYKPAFTSVVGSVRNAFAVNGWRGPFQGLPVTVIRNTPANSIYLGSFEVLKDKAAQSRGCTKAELPAAYVIGAGGFGGILYWLSIYPLDVIKSAQMTDHLEASKKKYPDMVTTAQKLFAEGGIKRFYRGFTPCIARAAPANGIMLYTVDKVNQLIHN